MLTWQQEQEITERDRTETRRFLKGMLFAALFNTPLILLAIWEWHKGILR